MPQSDFHDAASLTDQIFRPAEWDVPLMRAVMPVLAKGMALGATSEWALTMLAAQQLKDQPRKSTATDAISKYDMQELLDALPISIGTEMPQVLKDRIKQELVDTFNQPYWQKFNDTTRQDVQNVLEEGITGGLSIRDLAKEITAKMGPGYQQWRGTAAARTESTAACNAGHAMTMQALEDELQMPVGKEWVSVLGPTTRPNHAQMDGTQVPSSTGMFNLAGFPIPYPGHFSLPAGERINCQCTLISCFLQEATKPAAEGADLGETPEVVEPEPAIPALTADELKKLEHGPLEKIFTDHPDLNALYDEVMAYHSDELVALRNVQRELEAKQGVHGAARDFSGIVDLRLDIEKRQAKLREQFVERFGVKTGERKDFRGQDADRVVNGKILKSEEKEKMKEARQFLSSITHRKAGGYDTNSQWIRYHYAVDRQETRAYHNLSRCTMSPGDTQVTYIHESGHAVDHAVEMNGRSKEFRTYRTRGTPDINMKQEFPNCGYKANETGNEDKFLKAFGGDRNMAAYCGKWYSGDSSEIMSMGVVLLYEDPFAFAYHDPEYFKYVMGVLRGYIKNRK